MRWELRPLHTLFDWQMRIYQLHFWSTKATRSVARRSHRRNKILFLPASNGERASQPGKEAETWLELNSETLEVLQEELFDKEQGANITNKVAAAALEAANLKATDEINAAKLAAATLDLETAAIKRDAEKKAAENAKLQRSERKVIE
jgi:hypothetical protein